MKYGDVMEEETDMMVSSEKHQMVSKNVYELLSCPVCITLMSPPIHQCPNGHTLCSICKIRVQGCCPICRIDMGNIRCLVLEKVTEPLKPPYTCPYSHLECSITGTIPELVTHLMDNHNVEMYEATRFKHRYIQPLLDEMEDARREISVLSCYERQFCYHFEAFMLGTNPFYLAFFRFMGEDIDANKFSYSLELTGNGRSLTWKGVPRSIRDTHRKICDNLDGLPIPRNLALLYSDGDDQEIRLNIYAHIWIQQ